MMQSRTILRRTVEAVRATFVILGTGMTAGCTEPVGPCVKSSVAPGDTLGVTLLEVYDPNTTYEYDLRAFGLQGVITTACDYTRDLELGETLAVYVRSREESDHECSWLNFEVQDNERVQFGAIYGGPGFESVWPFGIALHGQAYVEGCERSWETYFYGREGIDALDASRPGELPTVLMYRRLHQTNGACSYTASANTCVFVVQLEKR